ncbi:urease accessory protein UreF [Nocardioides jiangxiensis]|uniref:Urease accessory UreF family protein n=1 Tax=Nocardioides jiangxiensis TaxID=3064524 RepID=A0ABT9AWT3_9ACTN|nr:urease accessory UreF family protein [Nocardioides sp. WY-20]MDO7866829.1 urease accessory UreF family protein [Nocardioides sp. WY-20]
MTSPATASDLVLMLLADARLPVAGHTQSAGLEPAVADGLRDVPGYIRTRLHTVTRVDAASAVVALHRLRQGMALDEVETAWAARTPSAAMRRTSRGQGKALLRLARRLWPDAAVIGTVASLDAPSRPLVLAACAAVTGLAPRSLARLVGYDDVQTVGSAALKLLPLDPADVACWVYDALPDVEAMADAVAALLDPHEIPAAGAPQLEAWAEAHARTTRRLFSA